MDRSEIYTEKLMNMIMDAVDDMIIIHDSEHTIIWMNRSAERAFAVHVEEMIGRKCYSLFGHSNPCIDYTVNNFSPGGPKSVLRRTIPKTGIECDCTTIPYYEEGKLRLVVQKLTPVKPITPE